MHALNFRQLYYLCWLKHTRSGFDSGAAMENTECSKGLKFITALEVVLLESNAAEITSLISYTSDSS